MNRWELLALFFACVLCIGTGIVFGFFPSWFGLGITAAIFLCFWITRNAESLLLFWLGTSPLFREYFNISGGGIPNITLDRVILLILAVWFIFVSAKDLVNRKKIFDFKKSVYIIILLFLYLVFEFLAYWEGVWRLSTLLQYYLDRVLLPVVTFLIARRFVRIKGENYAWKIIAILIWVGIISIVLEFLRRYAGIEPWLYPNGRGFIWDDVGGSRAVGEFYNPFIFGCMIIYSILGIYYWDLTKFLEKWKGLILFFMVWAILLTYTRSVWISFITISTIITFSGPKRISIKRYSIILLIILGVSGIILYFPIVQSEIKNRLLNINNIVFRQEYAIESIKMFMAKPIFGWGAGVFDSLHYVKTLDYSSNSYYLAGNPAHNSILLMLVDRGLVVFLPYIALIAYILIRSKSTYKNGVHNIKKLSFIIWACIIAYLITANTIQVEYFPYFICVFWLFLGVLSGLESNHSRSSIKRDYIA
jgi:hypothetical protein